MRILMAMVPIALFLFLLTSNVRLASTSLNLYSFLFDRYEVAQTTGILPDDLTVVGKEFINYFSNDAELLMIEAPVFGVRQPLLSEKEAKHMLDVKNIFNLTFRVNEGSGIFLGIILAIASLIAKRRYLWELGVWIQWGGLMTILLVLIIGLISLVAFGPLFVLFHEVAFRNDLWMLNPNTDYLLKLFPFGFWRDITLMIGLATLLEAVVLFIAARYFARLGTSKKHT